MRSAVSLMSVEFRTVSRSDDLISSITNQKMTDQDVPQKPPTVATNPNLEQRVNDLHNMVNSLYVPKHFETLMAKIGKMESAVQQSQQTMNNCYSITFFIVFLFIILVLVGVYVLLKMNVFRFLMRQNKFGNTTRPSTCFACYRPWRKRAVQKHVISKGSFSSPELLVDHDVPSGPVQVADTSSSSSDSSV